MKVALVIGHKHSSKGACSPGGLCEFEYCESFVSRLVKNLPEYIEPIVVYRGLYRDLPKKINFYKPDLIISFHANAYNTITSGSEILYYYKSDKSQQVAEILQINVVKALGLNNRGIKAKSAEERGGYLLRYTHAPCVISEPFFIDNQDDLAVAMEKDNILIDAYVKTIKQLNRMLT